MATATQEATSETKKPAKAKNAKAKKTPKTQDLITINPAALSITVGPTVIAGLAKTYKEEAKAHAMLEGIKTKRYDLLSDTTLAIVKLLKSDKSVDMSAPFSDDKKANTKFNEQVMIALGVKEYVDTGKGRKKLEYTKAVSKMFPTAKDQGEELQAKKTLRSNFVHMLKKCAQTAVSLVEKKIEATRDDASGTLKISGPAVMENFGAKEVLLNEKQTVKTGDKPGDSMQLKEKPSFQAVANLAAADHGAVTKKGSSDRTNKVVTDPEQAIASLADMMVKAISKLNGKASDATRKALEGVRSAIDKLLD